ncbi:MAG: TetR/AcrR family transcriptional regulator, partial [Caulobacteraceae bacterium]|nr:TetR/AcrR family transcriptional regulator [Caulobacteraceae bacterium]
FHDVSEAVLALAAAQSQSTPQLLAMLDHPWDPATAFEQSAAFTQLYVKTWKANRDLFRVRNLAADEGDRRFIDARYRAIAPLLDALSKIVATAQAQGRVRNDLAPFSTAAALIAMLDRISAVPSYRDDQHDGADPQLIRSASYFAVCALSGADPAVSG